MAKGTLKERILRFLDNKIKFHEKEIETFRNMHDRLFNNEIDEKELNGLLGIIKFWYSNREKEDVGNID